MATNYEWLLHMDGEERQAWFDAEHVDNTRSAKRAAAAERLNSVKQATDENLLDAILGAPKGMTLYGAEKLVALKALLTDDDGLRSNDGAAAEHVDNQFHGATRVTNLERLFVDSEQFRQAVSAFAFAHSDDCPTSPTQMVDWLMAEHVDAQLKAQSKTEPSLTEQSESLSDDLGHPTDMSQKSADCVRSEHEMSANDDLAPESDVIAARVDANDENATFNNSGDFVTDDSREKLEADAIQLAQNIWHQGQNYANGVREVRHIAWQERDVIELLDRQAEITHAETIHTYNLAAREARKVQKERIVDLEEELAKRDKGIARLKRQRDEARRELEKNRWEYCETCEHAEQVERLEAECDKLQDTVDNLRAECDESCVYKQEFRNMDKLEAERDALAADLRDCEQQRERLRQALGIAIDHAHEIVSLVNLDGEVIG